MDTEKMLMELKNSVKTADKALQALRENLQNEKKSIDSAFGRIAKRKPLIAFALRFPNTSQSGIKENAKNKYISVNFLDEGKEAAYTKTTEQRRQ